MIHLAFLYEIENMFMHLIGAATYPIYKAICMSAVRSDISLSPCKLNT